MSRINLSSQYRKRNAKSYWQTENLYSWRALAAFEKVRLLSQSLFSQRLSSFSVFARMPCILWYWAAWHNNTTQQPHTQNPHLIKLFKKRVYNSKYLSTDYNINEFALQSLVLFVLLTLVWFVRWRSRTSVIWFLLHVMSMSCHCWKAFLLNGHQCEQAHHIALIHWCFIWRSAFQTISFFFLFWIGGRIVCIVRLKELAQSLVLHHC